MSGPIRNPWDDWTPAPLPEWEQSLIDELDDYARIIESGKRNMDGKSMDAAAATSALYASQAWSDEWAAINPVKPGTNGAASNPRSLARFGAWQRHRAEKTGVRVPGLDRQKQLLKAQEIADNLKSEALISQIRYTEDTLAPLKWLISNGPKVGETYADQIPDVVTMAVELANGQPVGRKTMTQAVNLWKKKHTTRQQRTQAVMASRAKTKRDRLDEMFDAMLADDWETARDFIKDSYAKLKATAAKEAA